MSHTELYVVYRRKGLGMVEAAKAAGCPGDRPTPKARRLWLAAKKIYHVPEGAFDKYQERIEQKKREIREMQDIAKAVEILLVSEGAI